MRLIFDARPEVMYPLGKEGFSGGSQVYIKAITAGLADRGHEVHVITNDLEVDERRGPNLWYWPPTYFPRTADAAVMQMHARAEPEYEAAICVLMTSCVDPWLGPDHQFAASFDAVPVFSEVHKKLLCQHRPIPPEKCYVTGLGVELEDYFIPDDGQHPAWYSFPQTTSGANCRRMQQKVPGRLLFANDPARGLFNVLDIFDLIRQRLPEASLHVAYNFDQQHGFRAWEHSQMAELLWECKRRVECTPGVVKLGDLDRAGIIREELECQVHVMPSDPPAVGTQTHGITQMECAAAGAALILSDVEAFPEVFGEAATILPVIGKFVDDGAGGGRRVDAQDYADAVLDLMLDPAKWAEASRKARALAERNTWGSVVDRWEQMLAQVRGIADG